MTKPYDLISIFLFSLSIFWGWQWWQCSESSIGDCADQEVRLLQRSSVRDGVEATNVAAQTRTATVKTDSKKEIAQQTLIIKRWEETRGFASDDLRRAYQSFGDSNLRALAEQDDPLAIELLAQKALKEQSDKVMTRENFDALDKAAAVGSVHALIEHVNLTIELYKQYQSGTLTETHLRRQIGLAEDEKIISSTAKIALSNALVVQLRGDIIRGRALFQKTAAQILKRMPSDDETRSISEYAMQRYQKLKALRNGLGYSNFDNSYPEAYAKRHNLPLHNTMLDEVGKKLKLK